MHEFSRNFPHLILGRDPAGSHIFVGHESVSPQHAAVLWDGKGNCQVLNMESGTGVKLAGTSIPPGASRLIAPGEEIVLGKAPRRFRLDCGRVSGGEDPPIPGGTGAHVSSPAPPPLAMRRQSPHTPPQHADHRTHYPAHGPGWSPRRLAPMVSPVQARAGYPHSPGRPHGRSPGPQTPNDRRGPFLEQYPDRRREPPQASARRASFPPEERPDHGYLDRGQEQFRQGNHPHHREDLDDPRYHRGQRRSRSPSNPAFSEPDSRRRRGQDPQRPDYDQPHPGW
jgi:FHA domain